MLQSQNYFTVSGSIGQTRQIGANSGPIIKSLMTTLSDSSTSSHNLKHLPPSGNGVAPTTQSQVQQ